MDQPSISAEQAGGTKLKFKGVRHLLASGGGRKEHPPSWQPGGHGEQEAASPSQGTAAVSDSPDRPFSPSSVEPSPQGGAASAPWVGPRSVHGQPPGKQPYPDDRTPEAEALRARLQQQPEAAAAGRGPERGAEDGAGPRSVHGQPPGKQPHPDDPAFEALTAAAAASPGGLEGGGPAAAPQQQPGLPGGGGSDVGQPAGPGFRSVYGQPPGKQPDQIEKIKQVYQISASTQAEEDDLAEEQPQAPHAHPHARPGPAQQPPWRQHPQQQHAHQPPVAPGAQPTSPQQHVAAAAGPPQAYVPAPAASSHQARQRPAPPAPGGAGGGGGAAADKPTSRKRPASQAAGEGAQRKKAANGSAAATAGGQAAAGASSLQRLPTGMSSSRPFSSSMPRSGSLGGEGASQQIRTMPGAPRSLQQRQQLVNGATGGARPAGASRPKQPAGAAAKPKQQAKTPSSAQRRPSSAAGGGGAAAAAAQQYRPGDVVWAKIGVYPWWPAQLQRPTADEHFKPKHAVSDLFCVFYGSNDYNWLPASALKPFTETHPDYTKHASIKNKALQRAIDEAWVYGMQRERPDVHFGPGYGGGS